MQKIKLRTKIEIISAITFIIIIVAVSATALNRTITDNSDDIDTFIRNSNGMYWDAIGANIQLAIDDLSETGGTVWLPAGTIDLNNHITLYSGVNLIGAGMYSTVLRMASHTTKGNIYSIGQNNIKVMDMTIDGNGNNINGGNGIYFRNIKDFSLQDLYIHDCDAQGVDVKEYCTNGFVDNIFVKNTFAQNCQSFCFENTSYTTFSNLQVDNCPNNWGFNFHGIMNCTINNLIVNNSWGGIKIYGENGWDVHDSIVNNVRLSNIGATGNGMWIFATHGLSISNVHIEGGFNGFKVESSNYINANNIYTTKSNNVDFYIKNSDHINIFNVFSRNPISYGFAVENSYSCILSNFQVENPSNSNFLGSSTDITISYSKFQGGSGHGLDFQDCSRVKIEYCDFVNNAFDGIDTTQGACDNYSIIGCYFEGNNNAIDCNPNDDYIIITQNIFINDALDDRYLTKGYVGNNIGDDI